MLSLTKLGLPVALGLAAFVEFACYAPVDGLPADCGSVHAVDAQFVSPGIVGPHYRLGSTRRGYRNARYLTSAVLDGARAVATGWVEPPDQEPGGVWLLTDLVASPTDPFGVGGRADDPLSLFKIFVREAVEGPDGTVRVDGPRRILAVVSSPELRRTSESGVVCGVGKAEGQVQSEAFVLRRGPEAGPASLRWLGLAQHCLDARQIGSELVVAALSQDGSLMEFRVPASGPVRAELVGGLPPESTCILDGDGNLFCYPPKSTCRLDANGDLFCATQDGRSAVVRAGDRRITWLTAPAGLEPIVFLNGKAFAALPSGDATVRVLSADLSQEEPESRDFVRWGELTVVGALGLDLRPDGAAEVVASAVSGQAIRAVLCGGVSR